MSFVSNAGEYLKFWLFTYGNIGPHRAAENGDNFAVKQYLKLGSDINEVHEKRDHTILMAAVEKGNVELVKFLRDKNADPKVVNSSNKMAWDFATSAIKNDSQLSSWLKPPEENN